LPAMAAAETRVGVMVRRVVSFMVERKDVKMIEGC
jgi:hypothetical protein